MSKLSTKEIVHTILMPTDNTYRVISSRKTSFVKESVIMTGISELECNKLKEFNDLDIIRGNVKFYITPNDVICYGDIDFHEGSNDCEQLDTFNWLDNLDIKGKCIPSRYNYDRHECTSPNKYCLWTETFRNSTLCRYLHGCLGKPEFTLIFRKVK